MGAELSQDGLHVRSQRRRGYAERLGRGGRARAAREKPEHLELPGRERHCGFGDGAAGATQYLTKPFGPLELIDTIRGILAHS